jgi:hypothetical protein
MSRSWLRRREASASFLKKRSKKLLGFCVLAGALRYAQGHD